MNTTASSPIQIASTQVPFGRLAIAMGIRFLPILAASATFLALGINPYFLNVAIIGIDILTLVVLHFFMKAEGKRLRDLFLPFKAIDIAWGLLAFLIFVVTWWIASFISWLIVYQGQMPTAGYSQPSIPLWLGLISVVIMPITIALAEEALYRGYLQTRLSTRFGAVSGLLLSAIVFGIQHIGFRLPNIQASAVQVLTTLIAGLVLGGLMLWFKRTGPLVIAHWGLDFLFLGLPALFLAIAN
ncbi:MAG: type II CAAX endopeptidase family protein [Actinomycetaceae bacterium]|nr:type II CAAX endopeptidase family protein [Actinomycetaceae bacterium]